MSVNLIKPTAAAVRDIDQLTAIVLALYNEAIERRRPVQPDFVPGLKAITMASFADMRKLRGDSAGNLGPRCCLVRGKVSVADAGKGAFAWDDTSTAADDDTNTLAVFGVPVGRWVRIV